MSFDIRSLPLPRLLAVIFLILVAWVIGALWLGSFFYLWKIGQPRSLASPLLLYQYWTHYGDMPGVKDWVMICSGVAAVLLSFPFIAALLPNRRKLHGDAKLAKSTDLKKANMRDGAGKTFFLMKFGGKYVFAPSDKKVSIILAAPPRSGKGVSQVQPNMLQLDCSAIITDIRQESYQLTSGFRSQFSEVHLINPFPAKARDKDGKILYDKNGEEVWEARSSQWNPFYYVPNEQGLRINTLQKYGSFLFPDPPEGKDNFWAASSRSLFLGLALYVFETDELPKTMGEVLRQAQSGGDTGDAVSTYWAETIKKRTQSSKPLTSNCVQALTDFLSTGGNTITNIRKSLTAGLDLWQNPIVDAMTSGNSFDLRDLRKKKMTIYLGVSPDNLGMAKPLLSLFLQQAMDLNMQEMPADNPRIKYPLALLLDEVTALGRMEVFAKSIGYLNGYWICPYFIIQSFSQLRSVYGKEDAQTIIECCQIKMAFPPKSQEEAELLSKEFGYVTEKSHSDSTNKGFFNQNAGSTSTSVARRALFLPQEIKALGNDAIMMLAENVPPVIGKKVLYYKTPVFKSRLLPPHIAPVLDYIAILKQAENRASIQKTSKITTEAENPSSVSSSSFPSADLNPDFGSISAPEAAASAPKLAPPPEIQNGFDDIFSTPATAHVAKADNLEQEADASLLVTESDLSQFFVDISSAATDEKKMSAPEASPIPEAPERPLVPNTIQDYAISLEEILELSMSAGRPDIEISANLLPVLEEADLSDIMQDFSTVEIPQTELLSANDLENLMSGFMAVLPVSLESVASAA